jgi:hypothetical protein
VQTLSGWVVATTKSLALEARITPLVVEYMEYSAASRWFEVALHYEDGL